MVTEEWIRDLIKTNELWKFYKTKEWIRLKTSILKTNQQMIKLLKMLKIEPNSSYEDDEEM